MKENNKKRLLILVGVVLLTIVCILIGCRISYLNQLKNGNDKLMDYDYANNLIKDYEYEEDYSYIIDEKTNKIFFYKYNKEKEIYLAINEYQCKYDCDIGGRLDLPEFKQGLKNGIIIILENMENNQYTLALYSLDKGLIGEYDDIHIIREQNNNNYKYMPDVAYYLVEKNNVISLIDKSGNLVVKYKYTNVGTIDEFTSTSPSSYLLEKNFITFKDNNKSGILNLLTGDVILKPEYDDILFMSNDKENEYYDNFNMNNIYYKVKIGNKFYLFETTNNKKVNNNGYDNIWTVLNNVLIVEENNSIYFKDLSGKNLINDGVAINSYKTIKIVLKDNNSINVILNKDYEELIEEDNIVYEFNIENKTLTKVENTSTNDKEDDCDFNTGNAKYDVELKNHCEKKKLYGAKVYLSKEDIENYGWGENLTFTKNNLEKISEKIISSLDGYTFDDASKLGGDALRHILFDFLHLGCDYTSKELLEETYEYIFGQKTSNIDSIAYDDELTDNFILKCDGIGSVYIYELISHNDLEYFYKLEDAFEENPKPYYAKVTFKENNGRYYLVSVNYLSSIDNNLTDNKIESEIFKNAKSLNLNSKELDKISDELNEKVPFYTIYNLNYYNASVGTNIFATPKSRYEFAMYYIVQHELWNGKIENYLIHDDEEMPGIMPSYIYSKVKEFFDIEDKQVETNSPYANGGGSMGLEMQVKDKIYNQNTKEYFLKIEFAILGKQKDFPIEKRTAILTFVENNNKKVIKSFIYTK